MTTNVPPKSPDADAKPRRPGRPALKRPSTAGQRKVLQIILDEHGEIDLQAVKPTTLVKLDRVLRSPRFARVVEAVAEGGPIAPSVAALPPVEPKEKQELVTDAAEQHAGELARNVSLPPEWGRWPYTALGHAGVFVGVRFAGARRELAKQVMLFDDDEKNALAPVTTRLIAKHLGGRVDPDILELFSNLSALLVAKFMTLQALVALEQAPATATPPPAPRDNLRPIGLASSLPTMPTAAESGA